MTECVCWSFTGREIKTVIDATENNTCQIYFYMQSRKKMPLLSRVFELGLCTKSDKLVSDSLQNLVICDLTNFVASQTSDCPTWYGWETQLQTWNKAALPFQLFLTCPCWYRLCICCFGILMSCCVNHPPPRKSCHHLCELPSEQLSECEENSHKYKKYWWWNLTSFSVLYDPHFFKRNNITL